MGENGERLNQMDEARVTLSVASQVCHQSLEEVPRLTDVKHLYGINIVLTLLYEFSWLVLHTPKVADY